MADVVMADVCDTDKPHFLLTWVKFKYPLKRFIRADNEFQHQTSPHQTSDIKHQTSHFLLTWVKFKYPLKRFIRAGNEFQHQTSKHQTSDIKHLIFY